MMKRRIAHPVYLVPFALRAIQERVNEAGPVREPIDPEP